MQINKIIKPIVETKYLSVENSDRYRVILREFFYNYKKLKYYLYQEEIYNALKKYDYFEDYTEDQLKQDLSVLVNWNNLITMQDTRKVSTIEEFKNKKYRYRLSKYSIEIERLTIKLENLSVEGSSLESTLLERLDSDIAKFQEIKNSSDEKVYGWWNSLNDDFNRLNQNYIDYIRDLNSIKSDELLEVKGFILFKDRVVKYLRKFVKSLQIYSDSIGCTIKKINKDDLDVIINKYISHEKNIPRLDKEYDEEESIKINYGKYNSIREWFVGDEFYNSEVMNLYEATNEMIRKITRYASRISEMISSSINRKDEYEKVSKIFYKLDNINEAHKLSSLVFGVEDIIHLKNIPERQTSDINSGVYEEEPFVKLLSPRIRTYRDKVTRSCIIENNKVKEKVIKRELKKIERLNKIIDELEKEGEIVFNNLNDLDPSIRAILLTWISKAYESVGYEAKTENGRLFKLKVISDKIIEINCNDGILKMPDIKLEFVK